MASSDGTDPRGATIGVDVGGSAIKVAPVDTRTGRLTADRIEVPTPEPSTPEAVIGEIARVLRRVDEEMPDAGRSLAIGATVPSVVVDGVVKTAANIDQAWIDFPAEARLAEVLRRPVRLLNDADAAGIAEMRFGAGKGRAGTVIVLTLGTGVGSAIFVDGALVPNTELGHMELHGRDAEKRSAASVRTRERLSWRDWAANLDEHLLAIHKLFWPRLFILGGGISEDADDFIPRLSVPCEVVPAALQNDAGIVGAALVASARGTADATREPEAARR